MLCHVMFPYEWVECPASDICVKAAHLEGTPAELNEAPMEWLAALLGCSSLTHKNVEWRNADGERHREDGPAQEDSQTIRWYEDDLLHRVDGPAITRADGQQVWYEDGERHRVDGPAVVYLDGSEEWWINGVRHRLYEPAVVMTDGTREWWNGGQWHRVDGPAVIEANGEQRWYQRGKLMRPFSS